MKNLECLVLAVALLSLFAMGYAEEQENSLKEARNLLNNGDILLAEERYEDALQAYKKALKMYEDMNKDESIESIIISPAAREGIKLVMFRIGATEYHLKNYETARKKLEEILIEFPDFFWKDSARFLIARSYLEQESKDYAQAYIAFDRLATRESKDYAQKHLENLGFHLSSFREEAMYRTAYCSKQLGRYEEALALYMEFRTRFPKSGYVPDAYFDIGEIYGDTDFEWKDYDLALASYDLALKSADDRKPHRSKAEIQNAIGRTYYNQEDFEKARAAYNLLLEKYKENDINANYMIAHIYGKEKKWDEMINKYSSIIDNKIDGYIDNIFIDGLSIKVNTIAFSHFEIGRAYEMKENFKDAFKAYVRIVEEPEKKEKDLRTDPLAPFALYHAMDILNRLGDEEKPWSDVKEERWSYAKEEFDPERFAGKYISDGISD